MTGGADRAAFVRAATRPRPVPHVPEIILQTADEVTALWEKTETDLATIGLPPPFWAFPWAGGQALARYLLDHPDLVRGRWVLDVASGSGLVAIAAAMAGASAVVANDVDPFAVAAIRVNAELNGVTLGVREGDLVGIDEGWDVVLAGDISYERDMAARITGWLDQLWLRGADVLIGDPGRSYLMRERLECVATYAVPVTRDLEDVEIKQSSVWRFRDRGPASPSSGHEEIGSAQA